MVLSSARQIPPAVTDLDLLLDCTNLAPVASFTQSATTVRAGGAVAFDARASKDANGSVASYHWNFGDGTTGTGATPSHSYGTVGTFTPTLTSTDDQGLVSAVKTGKPVTVASAPGAIGGLSTSSGLHRVHLSWVAPASNNSPITGYTVDVTPGGQHLTTTATSLNVDGLTGNTMYTFAVRAANAFGSSAPATAHAIAGAANHPVVTITSQPKALTN